MVGFSLTPVGVEKEGPPDLTQQGPEREEPAGKVEGAGRDVQRLRKLRPGGSRCLCLVGGLQRPSQQQKALQ